MSLDCHRHLNCNLANALLKPLKLGMRLGIFFGFALKFEKEFTMLRQVSSERVVTEFSKDKPLIIERLKSFTSKVFGGFNK